ncbi:MAG: (4Fe-4S)-binding protein [Mucinivorans sp.]
MSKDRNRSYTNGEIIIVWRGAECIHNTLCYRELRSVFDPIKRPWIDPMGAPTERIKDIIERCPSQALTFRWVDPERNATEKSTQLYNDPLLP